jgi:hypothetical protein
MAVAKDGVLPPPTAAVVQNPAEPTRLVQEAAAQEVDLTEKVDDSDDVSSQKKKKKEPGMGNYFVSTTSTDVHVVTLTMYTSESSPMAPS